MKILEKKRTKINRSLSALGVDQLPCDVCGVSLVKGDEIFKAKIRDGYCTTSMYICLECHAKCADEDTLVQSSVKVRTDVIKSILDNAPTA